MFYETKQDAEDTAQTIFMRLWERKEKLHLIETIEKYLFTIMRNQFLDDRKSFARKGVVLKHYFSKQQTSANYTEQEVLFRETKEIINTSIRRLPSRMQHALTLKINGYKINKICSCMGVKCTTVRNHLQVAVKRMEACF
jgi:RNA polymerase sigma-70 factor (ECF subfamily)